MTLARINTEVHTWTGIASMQNTPFSLVTEEIHTSLSDDKTQKCFKNSTNVPYVLLDFCYFYKTTFPCKVLLVTF